MEDLQKANTAMDKLEEELTKKEDTKNLFEDGLQLLSTKVLLAIQGGRQMAREANNSSLDPVLDMLEGILLGARRES